MEDEVFFRTSVFRIHDILGWIRIRILGSMLLTNGSGSWIRIPDPDPAIFVIDLQDASKKLIFNTIFSAYYFLKVLLHHFLKIKSQKESQNRSNQGFYYHFCMMIKGSGSIPLTSGSVSGSREAQKHVDLVDPDPEHCFQLYDSATCPLGGFNFILFLEFQ
jgi:hypothetical protein